MADRLLANPVIETLRIESVNRHASRGGCPSDEQPSQVGVITFPGSNGDHDACYMRSPDNLGVPTRLVDYRETDLAGFAAVVVPGGFSYGDYLRCGAIARFAPVMSPLRRVRRAGRSRARTSATDSRS